YERDDYAGAFDPDFRYEDLSKEALVRLVREYALTVHLLDRSALASVGMRYGQQVVEEVAIDEWRGASPIYGERLRRIMGIHGRHVHSPAVPGRHAACAGGRRGDRVDTPGDVPAVVPTWGGDISGDMRPALSGHVHRVRSARRRVATAGDEPSGGPSPPRRLR